MDAAGDQQSTNSSTLRSTDKIPSSKANVEEAKRLAEWDAQVSEEFFSDVRFKIVPSTSEHVSDGKNVKETSEASICKVSKALSDDTERQTLSSEHVVEDLSSAFKNVDLKRLSSSSEVQSGDGGQDNSYHYTPGNDNVSLGSSCSDLSSEEESSEEGEDSGDAALSMLSAVARRRTSGRDTRGELVVRLRAVLEMGSASVILCQILCEFADAFLARFQTVLGDSEIWNVISGGGYTPGSVCTGFLNSIPAYRGKMRPTNVTLNVHDTISHLNTFLNATCGCPASVVAFGPVKTSETSSLVQALGLLPGNFIYGTFQMKNGVVANRPSSPVIESIKALEEALKELEQHNKDSTSIPNKLQELAGKNTKVLIIKAAVLKALNGIDRVQVGQGGTLKCPTQFQMEFVQRLIAATQLGIKGLVPAFA